MSSKYGFETEDDKERKRREEWEKMKIEENRKKELQEKENVRLENLLQKYQNKLKDILTDYVLATYREFMGVNNKSTFVNPERVRVSFKEGKVWVSFTLDHCYFDQYGKNIGSGKMSNVRVFYRYFVGLREENSVLKFLISNYSMAMYWLMDDKDFIGMGGKGSGDSAYETNRHFCLPQREALRDTLVRTFNIPTELPECNSKMFVAWDND